MLSSGIEAQLAKIYLASSPRCGFKASRNAGISFSFTTINAEVQT